MKKLLLITILGMNTLSFASNFNNSVNLKEDVQITQENSDGASLHSISFKER